ncbi:glycosyltransferase family 4 protein [Flavobacterium sp. SUN046]|uniref:glycosyltransferase family 4 protein n=1 Tax=Flavobacterium sp. SUN046 TaxID=3002440 RepID=UPI002DB88047|nr:glycosyltransferase family 4 protein [Flavobacterium sp. SUN046]MEC4050890.1 glycosyltransferase family 4 protein [Flavobacterium sp. SUN046]
MINQKLFRITTVPISLDKLLGGQLKYMSSFFDVTAISSDKVYLEKIGNKENVRTFHLEMTRKITPIQDCIAVFKLCVFLKKEKPYIVHTHTPKAGLVGMLAARIVGVPNRLHTVAGLPLLEATGLKRKLLDFVESFTYSCSTKVFPNSNGLLEIIKKNEYCKADKLKVLAKGSSNGINTAFFSPDLFSEEDKKVLKDNLKIKETDFVFIFVGRIVADKGINELILAFDELSKTVLNAKLILVGPFEHDLDPLKKNSLDLITNNKSIISVGYQNDVRPYFSISNVLVFPSYREGFPNVVMQAGAMGLPCIVSDINGCNEIVVNNSNGIVIPVKNKEAIYDSMKLLIQDMNLYLLLKKKAREVIVTSYEQQVVWQALLNMYKSL